LPKRLNCRLRIRAVQLIQVDISRSARRLSALASSRCGQVSRLKAAYFCHSRMCGSQSPGRRPCFCHYPVLARCHVGKGTGRGLRFVSPYGVSATGKKATGLHSAASIKLTAGIIGRINRGKGVFLGVSVPQVIGAGIGRWDLEFCCGRGEAVFA